MATALDKIRQSRQIKLEQTAEEKEEAIDNLFAKFGSAPPQKPTAPNPPRAAIAGGIEIYSVFGGGSILVNGKDTPLPYIVSSPVEMNKLREEYPLDHSTSPLRTRKV